MRVALPHRFYYRNEALASPECYRREVANPRRAVAGEEGVESAGCEETSRRCAKTKGEKKQRGNSVTWHGALCHLAFGFALIVHHPFASGERGEKTQIRLEVGSSWTKVHQ